MKTYSSTPKKRKLRGKLSQFYYTRERDTVTGARRWVSTGKTSFDAARKFIRKLELAEVEGKPRGDNVAFPAAVDKWLATKEPRMTPAGYKTYKSYSKAWKRFFPEKATVRAITPSQVERYFVNRGLEVSQATLNKERIYLRQFFAWCHDHDLVSDRDPVRTVRKYREAQRAIRALTQTEQRKLLKACAAEYKAKAKGRRNTGGIAGKRTTKDNREWQQTHRPPAWLAPLVRLALATGLRRGSLFALTWKDVDFQKGVIHLKAAQMKAKRDLVLPLDQETAAWLRKLKRSAGGIRVLNIPHPNSITKSFEAAVKRAGIGECRFHDLRATFITDCARAGVGLEVTAKLAGHADIATTAKFYRSIEDDELREAVAKRAAAGGGK